MSTASTHRSDYRAALRRQLDAAGEAALDMMAGHMAVDSVILLSAVEAAGLLGGSPTESGEALEHRVARAAQRSPLPDQLVRDALDLSIQEWPSTDAPLQREARVHRMVAFAALQPFVSTAERWRLANVVDDAAACFEVEPERFADLSDLALFLEDQLDLAASHPAMALLKPLRRAAEFAADPVPDALLQHALADARQRVALRSRRSWRDVLDHWGEAVRSFLDQQAEATVLAFAADDDDLPEADAPPSRALWEAPGRGQISLVRLKDGLAVEWFGEKGATAPSAVRMRSDETLAEVDSSFPGALRWVFPDVPPEGRVSLVIDFGEDEVYFPADEGSE